MCSDNRSEFGDCSGGCGTANCFHFHPLGVGIYNDQEHMSEEASSIVDMQTRPGPFWPFPWLNRSNWRQIPRSLTGVALSHFLF